MSLVGAALHHRHVVISLALATAVLGIWSLLATPTDLFPESAPPQVAVIAQLPGTDASDMADTVALPLEREFNTIPGQVRVASTSRTSVSSITVEFGYAIDGADALVAVQNAVAKARGRLPAGIREPRLFRISDATRPLMTLAVRPGEKSLRSMAEVRILAENALSDTIMALPGIAEVEVFGGHQQEIAIDLRRQAAVAHGLDAAAVAQILRVQQLIAPAGTLRQSQTDRLVVLDAGAQSLAQLGDIVLRRGEAGVLRLADVADLRVAESPATAIYHGNGHAAIALNVLRPEGGATVDAIRTLKAALPELRARYPDLIIEVTDDQQPLIDINVAGMQNSLWQAIVITVVVIFIFLASARAAAVVALSIPLSFLASLALLRLTGNTLNMVTLSGLIISVGMVVDAAVVVIENITRHHRDNGGDADRAAITGTAEVAMEIAAGMLTTVVVLLPVLFTGGYTQQVMRPLNTVVISTLLASLLCALTVVPLLARRLLAGDGHRNLAERTVAHFERLLDMVAKPVLKLLQLALRHRLLTLGITLVTVIVSLRTVMPLLGGELMPPMDTGIVTVEAETPSGWSTSRIDTVLSKVEAAILATTGVETVSGQAGSEPGVVSFGGGATTRETLRLTVRLVDRTRRDDDIWAIMGDWRQQIAAIDGVQSLRLAEYGATPMATTKAPLHVRISGDDPAVLDTLADRSLDALDSTPGLVDLRRSWHIDREEWRLRVDAGEAARHGLTPAGIAAAVQSASDGAPAGSLRVSGIDDLPLVVRLAAADLDRRERLEELPLIIAGGQLPLRAVASLEAVHSRPFISREFLRQTVDLTANSSGRTIKEVAGLVSERLDPLALPAGYTIEVAGSAADMAQNQARMGKALLLGMLLLYLVLVATFRSFTNPLVVLAAIPPAVAAAMWGLLLFDKPMCMPAIMGLILLAGTIVNNSILLIGFIEKAKADGMAIDTAILESVRLRLRPILMTTVSTVLGLTPLIFEMAVGLERMSPLGIAAASGLIGGTLVTLVVVPVLASFGRRASSPAAG
jgi:multidrug efflux pump subunit AcrB